MINRNFNCLCPLCNSTLPLGTLEFNSMTSYTCQNCNYKLLYDPNKLVYAYCHHNKVFCYINFVNNTLFINLPTPITTTIPDFSSLSDLTQFIDTFILFQ